MTRASLLSLLALPDPLIGFGPDAYPGPVEGWNTGAPRFRELVREALRDAPPGPVIELGAWLGQSTIVLAEEAGPDRAVISVDTWLGSEEWWIGPIAAQRREGLRAVNGWPTAYYHWLANLVRAGVADRVVPMAATTEIAARVLAHHGVRSPLAFVDASHEKDSVCRDIALYWPLLAPGGVMLGDDLSPSWPGIGDALYLTEEAGIVDCERFELEEPWWMLKRGTL